MNTLFLRTGIFFFFLIGVSPSAFADIRVSDAVEVESGVVTSTSVISDKKGTLFLEFIKGTRVLANVEGSYEGAVMPPEIIDMPYNPPKPRMKDLAVFDLFGSQEDVPLVFADKIQFLKNKAVYRLEHYNPDAFERTAYVKLYMPVDIESEQVSLWQYIWDDVSKEIDTSRFKKGGTFQVKVESSLWKKIGGKLELSSDGTHKIFTASLKETGIYGVFDENPVPTGTDPSELADIELAEAPPYVDEFIDPSLGMNEASLFDAENLDLYDGTVPNYIGETENSFDPIIPASGYSSSAPLLPTDTGNSSGFIPGNTDMIPAVQSSNGVLESQNESPPAIPLYASYIQCDKEFETIESFPGASLSQRPDFLNPLKNKNPLTQNQVNQLPANCKIYIPEDVMQAYQKALLEPSTPQDQDMNPIEDIKPSPLSNTTQNTADSSFQMTDLQANSFSEKLPQTGKKEPVSVPVSVLFIFTLVGASLWVALRSSKNGKKKPLS